MKDRRDNEREDFSLSQLPKPQKYGLYFLGVLALGIIILWIWQFNYRLSSPFRSQLADDQVAVSDSEIFSELKEMGSQLETIGQRDDSVFTSPEDPAFTDEMIFNPEAESEIQIDTSLLTGGYDLDLLSGDDYEQALIQALSGLANPQVLRDLLVDSGLDEQLVNQLSDEELMEIYQDVLEDQLLP